MPDLDLEPENYRATPIKGEPIFRPGGKRLLLLILAIITLGILLRFVVHEPIGQLVRWAWPTG